MFGVCVLRIFGEMLVVGIWCFMLGENGLDVRVKMRRFCVGDRNVEFIFCVMSSLTVWVCCVVLVPVCAVVV